MCFYPASVVVHEINVSGFATLKPEYEAPVAGDVNSVIAGQPTMQRMQPVSGPVQMLNLVRGSKISQDQLDPVDVQRIDFAAIALFQTGASSHDA
jgi:hypothetical protein